MTRVVAQEIANLLPEDPAIRCRVIAELAARCAKRSSRQAERLVLRASVLEASKLRDQLLDEAVDEVAARERWIELSATALRSLAEIYRSRRECAEAELFFERRERELGEEDVIEW